MIEHHFTVDVEEYFNFIGFESRFPRSDWDKMEGRVENNVARMLDSLARHDAKGTFFILGWLGNRYPQMVRAIAAEGHEVASHGWEHRRVLEMAPAEFRDSVRRTKQRLEDLIGQPVVGYRAPHFSIVRGDEWALDILVEEGYRYDSTLFPVRRPGYGYTNGKRDPHQLARPGGSLVEIPPATLSLWKLTLPAGGGAYFRIFPYALVRSALLECQNRGVPGTFYIHPWEIDPDQPRLPVPTLERWRHYWGLQRTSERLERLLSEFRFRSILETLDSQ
jgi:polysaccharide deacetylase family protein (PEP-CTERM system associated)